MKPIFVKQGDLLPVVGPATLKFEDGTGRDLTDCTVNFHLTNKETGELKVDAPAVITDVGPPGQVEYRWQGTDTNTPGRYKGEFEVTRPDTKTQTWPTIEELEIIILEELA